MDVYSIVLFVHIVGALGLFVALGIEFLTVSRVRSAVTAEQAREWLSVLGSIRVIGPLALATILVPGLYMAATSTGWQGWNVAALVAMVVMAALGAASNAARMPGIGRSIGPLRGALLAEARGRLRDPIVWSSILVHRHRARHRAGHDREARRGRSGRRADRVRADRLGGGAGDGSRRAGPRDRGERVVNLCSARA